MTDAEILVALDRIEEAADVLEYRAYTDAAYRELMSKPENRKAVESIMQGPPSPPVTLDTVSDSGFVMLTVVVFWGCVAAALSWNGILSLWRQNPSFRGFVYYLAIVLGVTSVMYAVVTNALVVAGVILAICLGYLTITVGE